jgi:7-carboxy-7-deazaguanine synthase
MLSLVEIVDSLQGEGKYTGIPTTFIRLYGCNLYCSFCDSEYARNGKRRNASIETIMNAVYKLKNKHVCITGGEPLLQDDIYPLIYELVDRQYIVSIETNGSIEIEMDTYNRSFSYCMDVKTPSSKMAYKNKYSNLARLLSKDEVKFVISDFEDFMYAIGVIKQYPTKASVIFSPCFKDGESNAKEIASWMMDNDIPNVRLGMQLHRIIGIY